ncbi:MAG TPA: sulfite exporter TauE/SafE family protein [Burkholderiaceae bacterium]|nr:sulfite exporter TauE/SafE family protein [Burkholderiaceae bacterium]
MPSTSLLIAAALLGLAGGLHCAGMCSAWLGNHQIGMPASTGVLARHLGRWLSYSAAGVIAGAFGQVVWTVLRSTSVIGPLWTLLQVAALVLGLWLMFRGQWPRRLALPGSARPIDFRGPARSRWRIESLRGAALLLMPCGQLHAALWLAVLAGTWQGGLALMAVFALASSLSMLSIGLGIRKLAGWSSSGAGALVLERQVMRLTGLMLVVASAVVLWAHLSGAQLPWCDPVVPAG